jgi:large subunit ribosomal protein L25
MAGTELISIEGSKRDIKGKGAARKLRANGKVPANILQAGKATSITLDPKWLSRAWQNGKTFNLVLDGETKEVRMHELQIDPVKRTALHVDLMYV